MFKFLICLAVIGICHGARIPRTPSSDIDTVRLESENGIDGAYNFMYEGSDGSFREEKAVPMNVGQEDEYLAITGSYRYITGEGKEVEVHYTADTRGFIITGQTIHDSGVTSQPKSNEATHETNSENHKIPIKSIPENINESSSKSPSEEVTSESANESSSQASSEAPTEE